MRVDGTKIYMTRGDSESITVSASTKIGNIRTPRPFGEGDTIEMTVRQFPSSPSVAMHKTVTEFTEDGKAVIAIDPADTADLSFGTYSYDIQLTDADGGVHTIVRPSEFIVGEEDTYGEDSFDIFD